MHREKRPPEDDQSDSKDKIDCKHHKGKDQDKKGSNDQRNFLRYKAELRPPIRGLGLASR